MSKLIIAIDGPVGSGKSTVARRVAELLGYTHLDSGAMYRGVAWKALRDGVPLDSPSQLSALANAVRIDLVPRGGKLHVILDGEDITDLIRTREVSHAASVVAGHHGNHGRRVRYFPRANQIRDVFAVKDHMQLPAARYEVNAHSVRQRRKLRRRVQWHAVAQRFPRNSAVHRSAIEMCVAQQFGYAPRHRALPGTHRTVNRDDEFAHPNSVKFA